MSVLLGNQVPAMAAGYSVVVLCNMTGGAEGGARFLELMVPPAARGLSLVTAKRGGERVRGGVSSVTGDLTNRQII